MGVAAVVAIGLFCVVAVGLLVWSRDKPSFGRFLGRVNWERVRGAYLLLAVATAAGLVVGGASTNTLIGVGVGMLVVGVPLNGFVMSARVNRRLDDQD